MLLQVSVPILITVSDDPSKERSPNGLAGPDEHADVYVKDVSTFDPTDLRVSVFFAGLCIYDENVCSYESEEIEESEE